MSNTLIYDIWVNMLARCYNSNVVIYRWYGGRGIKVCERWHIFENFYEDIKNLYHPFLSMDRVNNNGNYELSNIRWTDPITQNRNK